MPNNYDLSKFEINYQLIWLLNKCMSQGQFVNLCKGFSTNYFIIDSGFIHEKILNKMTIGYLDIIQPDDDSIGRQRMRAEKCEYRVYGSMRLKDPEDSYYSYIKERYEIVIVDIHKSDYKKFKSAMSSVINIAFNNRELEYFEVLASILEFAYSIIKNTKRDRINMIKNNIKWEAYEQYYQSSLSYIKNLQLILEALHKHSEIKHDDELYGRRIHNNKGSLS